MLEIFGFVTGLLYLFLEIMQKKIMWVVGAISGAAYIIIFMNQGLYANMTIQVYYLLVSVYGWCMWAKLKKREKKNAAASSDLKANREEDSGERICYKHADRKTLAWSVLLVLILSAVLFFFLKFFDKDPMPLLDSATFSLSIIATWWLSRCIIDQWIVWVFTDVSIAIICFNSGLVLSGILYIIYSVFAAFGYLYWKKVGVKL
ncbi:MAG: nicotinamide riboside transporter PnuC [Bacteroidales bacterium]|nr:nicotinamide riboside transporter PnuC [Bacteroidales bacterium]